MTRDPCEISECPFCGSVPRESNVNWIKLKTGWLNLDLTTSVLRGTGGGLVVSQTDDVLIDVENPADVAALAAALDSMCLCPVAPASLGRLYVGEPDVPEPPAVEGEG